MQEKHQSLVEKAKTILNNNWLGKSTKPAPDLYPHQWNWDSGFIAIGYSGYNSLLSDSENF